VTLPRLYAILDVELTGAAGLTPEALLDLWLEAGVMLIQLRAKRIASGELLDLADRAVRSARQTGAALIVNDRADLAALAGADGVHVGQDDLLPRDARRLVGQSAVVGLSTHTDAQVAAALAEPIDYLAIGPVFDTATKTAGHRTVGIAGVRRAVDAAGTGRPVVAIGGVTLDRAPAVLEAGAASIAVVSDLLKGDPRVRVREYLAVLGPTRTHV
jgi:thiamine-phosphate pyrophosphorylase